MSYEVTTPVFEGPFDLLLHLILREQVELYDIYLTKIVDAYIVELDAMESFSLDVATEFLLIAATLIELKTRRLLPGDNDLDLDDELALWSERDLLLTRLVECKTFKDAAVALQHLANEAGRSYPRVAGPDDRYLALTPDLLAGVTPVDVHLAFLRAVTPRPQLRIDLEHVAPMRASVADAVMELLEELCQQLRLYGQLGHHQDRLDGAAGLLEVGVGHLVSHRRRRRGPAPQARSAPARAR